MKMFVVAKDIFYVSDAKTTAESTIGVFLHNENAIDFARQKINAYVAIWNRNNMENPMGDIAEFVYDAQTQWHFIATSKNGKIQVRVNVYQSDLGTDITA